MKSASLILTVSFLSLLPAGAAEKPAETNAYRLVFFDKANRPLAYATLFTPEFKKEDRKPKAMEWKIQVQDYPSKAEEVKQFRQLIHIDKNAGAPQAETKKQPDFPGGPGGKGAHVRIQFNPRIADANIGASLNLDEKEPAGTWSYSSFTGGFTGGKVTATRIHADK
jgi:hypothetical protein